MVAFHPPGSEATDMRQGDIILTHANGLIHALIRFGQGLRFRGERRRFAYWNHAAICVLDKPGYERIAEALGHGVEETFLDKYRDTEYVHIRLDSGRLDQEQIQYFVKDVLAKKTRYGYTEMVSLFFSLLIPLPIQFGSPGTMICSGLCAQALTRAGVIWPVSPEYAMPADIAEYYDAGNPHLLAS